LYVVCDGAEVTQDQENYLITVKKKFNKGDAIDVTFPMKTVLTNWYRTSVAVERGPLVYGLDMKERWEIIGEAGGVKDYSVYPESPWNYAINKEINPQIEEREVSNIPFSKANAPIRMKIAAKQLASWKEDGGNTGELPKSPVSVQAKEEQIALIPFGCTKLRVSQFPYYESEA
jgi:hypothetical protein